MKINKEKLIKYIRDNIKSFEIMTSIMTGVRIDTPDMVFSIFFINYDYNIRIIPTNTGIESKLFKITEGFFDELMKIADENTAPEIQEFYKQICDEE